MKLGEDEAQEVLEVVVEVVVEVDVKVKYDDG